jgi:bifunctional DNA-binding transcriptional regulator/antitoxin component of YhaV-PrlF toxin-antitoxin module
MIIENVDLIPERTSYKIDGSGRVVIPAHLRNKFRVENGDYMEYFTAYVDGDWFLCCRKDEERTRIEREKEAAKAAKKTGK